MKRALGQIEFALLVASQFVGLWGVQGMVAASPSTALNPLTPANNTAAFSG